MTDSQDLPTELAEGVRPHDTQVTAALAAKAVELWGDEEGDRLGLEEFLTKLGRCYNELSPYNDYDLDIDL